MFHYSFITIRAGQDRKLKQRLEAGLDAVESASSEELEEIQERRRFCVLAFCYVSSPKCSEQTTLVC